MFLVFLALETVKAAAMSLVPVSIHVNGLRAHIVYHLIHRSAQLKVVLSVLSVAGITTCLVLPGGEGTQLCKSGLFLRLAVGAFHHDFTWAVLAWVRYVKVVRQDLWATADLALWRRRAEAAVWAAVTFVLVGVVPIRVGLALIADPGVDVVGLRVMALVMVSVTLLAWVACLVPYLLLLKHVGMVRSADGGGSRDDVDSREETIYGIYNPSQLQNLQNQLHPQQYNQHQHHIPTAWAALPVGPVNSNEQDDMQKVLSTSLTSLVVFFLLGIPKVSIHLYMMYGLSCEDKFPRLRHLDIFIAIKTVEGVLDCVFELYNCRNILTDMIKSYA